jgi:hypothetical protein
MLDEVWEWVGAFRHTERNVGIEAYGNPGEVPNSESMFALITIWSSSTPSSTGRSPR